MSEEHYEVATTLQQILQRHDLQDIIAILGMDELLTDDKLVVARAAHRALPAELRRRAVHGDAGKYVKLEDTIRGFSEIIVGQHDELLRVGVLHGRHDRGRGGRRSRPTPSA